MAAIHEAEMKKAFPEHDTSSDEHVADGIHDGLQFPSEEERLSLRRVSDTIPWAAYLIAIVEMAERFSYYGSTVVFTNFIQQPLPDGSNTGAGGADGQSGALGRGLQTSTGLTTFYQFWAYLTPILGGYLADTYWGRYNTICVAIGVAFIGHIVLIVSAIPSVVVHSNNSLAAFIIGMLITGLGTGLFKSNISTLIAEQYKRRKLFVVTTKDGERVIVDPTYTVSRMYMYFYLFTNIGALIGQITMTYAEKASIYVGFYLAFTLPTVVFLICPVVMFLGRNYYNRTPPTGSVTITAFRLWLFASGGRWSWNPFRTWKNMKADDFWENAKPSKQQTRPHWMSFDDQWVDEVRRGIKACGVFVWYPIYWLSYNQLNNNLTSQAATMSTHGLPNDILSNLDPLALIIFIPIFDAFLYPALKRMHINFSALKKITAGFATGAAAMVWASVVQHYIYKTSPCGDQANSLDCEAVSPLNVWIQTGSYVLIAFSEIFASITGLEYAFTKAPKNMRSLVMAMYLVTNAFGAALSEAFLPLLVDPLLTWNYGAVAIIAAVGGTAFWISIRKLDAQEDQLNNLAEGHMVTPGSTDREKV
ncbi:PTR2-domain-containing protein [Dendrothele bispora CBS 962.96]|uniref:PTR2-domain-containing protein n=1 Tax=Dendrothele bispora (strain CBS 962.96) TaxID=1314807 RepID=A0A4S8LA23_DENBC|nr:PTR2-domain-containing protein [Dendrothele bispora CBS 962.96]